MWVTLAKYNETYKASWFITGKSRISCNEEGELIALYEIWPV